MKRVNRDIKTIFGISFGSTNFTIMRNRIIYCINQDTPILSRGKKNTNKRIGKRLCQIIYEKWYITRLYK